jgi:hypothetical protein
MRTLLLAILCGYLGYQLGKGGLSNMTNYVVEKRNKVSDLVDDISYLKISETGTISFVGDKESASVLTSSSARNAIDFLIGIYKDSSINLISV